MWAGGEITQEISPELRWKGFQVTFEQDGSEIGMAAIAAGVWKRRKKEERCRGECSSSCWFQGMKGTQG